MEHDQGPDSSSKPYRRNQTCPTLGLSWDGLGCPVGLSLGGWRCPIRATRLLFRGGERENQPNRSLIGGSHHFQPATKPPARAKPGFDYQLSTSLPGKSSLQLIERL